MGVAALPIPFALRVLVGQPARAWFIYSIASEPRLRLALQLWFAIDPVAYGMLDSALYCQSNLFKSDMTLGQWLTAAESQERVQIQLCPACHGSAGDRRFAFVWAQATGQPDSRVPASKEVRMCAQHNQKA